MVEAMKHFARMIWGGPRLLIALTVLLGLAFNAPVARAQYKDGLVLVRQGKWAKAIKKFSELARNGHAQSQFSLGLIYHLGRGVPKNIKKAYGLYKASALQDHPPAVNNLGMMYLNGEYVAKNQDIAFKLFLRASADHAQAKDNLAQAYENGWGTDVDIDKAINFYELAGVQGYKLGYYHLAQVYEEGRGGTPVDMKKAIKWYKTAGEDSYARGYFRIGEIYEQGINLKRDLKEALRWYQDAADLSYTPALDKLSTLRP